MHPYSMLRHTCFGLTMLLPMTGIAAQNNSNSFNPEIGVILNGRYTQFDHNPENYVISGFALADETGPGEEGFSLGESELSISANIDDLFYGRITTALTTEDSVEIEEAFVETVGLDAGMTVKFGRFFSGIGYLNQKHSHTWDFVDQPLAYKAMLGNQYGDDGLQIRWLAPTDQFLELGVEAMRGENFPAGGAARNGKGSYSLFARTGGDLNNSHSWLAGLSYLDTRATDRATGDPAETFSGHSKLSMLDLVWKWAPNGNRQQTNLTVQTEYFIREEDGTYQSTPYQGRQRGYYLQGVYQFMPRWRTGLRYDRLQADDLGSGFTGTALDSQGHQPERWSAMLDFSRTEFSRLRLQFNLDKSGPQTDHQWYAQYIMSLGAHGAHGY